MSDMLTAAADRHAGMADTQDMEEGQHRLPPELQEPELITDQKLVGRGMGAALSLLRVGPPPASHASCLAPCGRDWPHAAAPGALECMQTSESVSALCGDGHSDQRVQEAWTGAAEPRLGGRRRSIWREGVVQHAGDDACLLPGRDVLMCHRQKHGSLCLPSRSHTVTY
jgi:hypothetical protein